MQGRMMADEIIRLADVRAGGTLQIRRCDLAGWEVMVNGQNGFVGQIAAFSNVADLLEWLTNSLKRPVPLDDAAT